MSEGAAPGRTGIPLPILLPAVAAAAALWFLRTALAPFFLAGVLAYLMQPLTALLTRRMRRGWAALLAILAFTLVLGLFLWALVPPFVAQVERLVAALPAWQEQVINRWLPWLNAHPVVQAKLRSTLEGVDPMAFIHGLRLAGAGLLGWFLELMTLILVPLIVYYLLVEGPGLGRGMRELVPLRFRSEAESLAAEINRRLGGYIRGQLAVALVMSFLQGLAFQILGVPYSWVLGLLAGLCQRGPLFALRHRPAPGPAVLRPGRRGPGATSWWWRWCSNWCRRPRPSTSPRCGWAGPAGCTPWRCCWPSSSSASPSACSG